MKAAYNNDTPFMCQQIINWHHCYYAVLQSIVEWVCDTFPHRHRERLEIYNFQTGDSMQAVDWYHFRIAQISDINITPLQGKIKCSLARSLYGGKRFRILSYVFVYASSNWYISCKSV